MNTGTYILEPEIFNYFDSGTKFDFSNQLFPLLLEKNIPIYGYVSDDYWCDVGDLEAYLKAHYDILNGKIKISIPGKNRGDNIWIDRYTNNPHQK